MTFTCPKCQAANKVAGLSALSPSVEGKPVPWRPLCWACGEAYTPPVPQEVLTRLVPAFRDASGSLAAVEKPVEVRDIMEG